MDVATIGFWELIGTPAEIVHSGEKMILKLFNDDKKLVSSIVPLKGNIVKN